MIFFTSDQHFCHENIIGYENRPFKNLDDMHKTLIENWNSEVSDDDEVYVLGDFSLTSNKNFEEMTKITKQLKGSKYLLKGSHDRYTRAKYLEMGFKDFIKKKSFSIQNFTCVHDPGDLKLGLDIDSLILCGHVHSLWTKKNLGTNNAVPYYAVNVGVDVWDFKPVNFERLKTFISLAILKSNSYMS